MPSKRNFHLLSFFSYVGLVILINWPLIMNINTHVIGRIFEDAFEVLWQLWWMDMAVFQQQVNPFYTPDVFYPLGWHIASGAQPAWFILLLAPLTHLTGNIFTYNFVLLSTFVFAGFGVYRLVYHLTQQASAGFVAGCVYIVAPTFTMHMGGHLHTLFSMAFLPYATLGFYQTFHAHEREIKRMALTGVALALTILGMWYFLFIAVIPLVVLSFFIAANIRWREWALRLALIGITTLVCILPFAYLTWNARQLMFPDSGDFPLAASDVWGVSLRYLFAPNPNHPLWGAWSQRHFPVMGEHNIVSVGYMALILALTGLLFSQRQQTRPFAAMATTSLLLAMGPILQWNNTRLLFAAPTSVAVTLQRLYPDIPLSANQAAIPLPGLFLYHWLPFYASMRVWARFVIPLMLALAVLAGYGASFIAGRSHKWRYILLPALFLIVFEGLTAPYNAFTAVSRNHRAVNQWLAEQPPGTTLIEYPRPWVDKLAMYSQSLHGQRVVNGYMSTEPDYLRQASSQLGAWPNPEALKLLREWQVQYMVVTDTGSEESAVILRQIETLPGLCHIETFDDGFMNFPRTRLYALIAEGEKCPGNR